MENIHFVMVSTKAFRFLLAESVFKEFDGELPMGVTAPGSYGVLGTHLIITVIVGALHLLGRDQS